MEDVDGAVQNGSRGLESAGWEALGQADLAIVGLVTCVDSAVGLLVLHIMNHWRWAPYMTKIPLLLIITGVAVRKSCGVVDSRLPGRCSLMSVGELMTGGCVLGRVGQIG